MNATPRLHQPSSLSTSVAAALAAFVATGILSAVAVMFQRDGAPLEQLVTAERSCAHLAYVSERETCRREWLAAAHKSKVAGN